MKRVTRWAVFLGLALVVGLPAVRAAAEDKKPEAPETITFDKTGKMAPVVFPHKKHADKLGGCKECHEGEKPLFPQKKQEEGMKMADMYVGKNCGACHDGKKKVGDTVVFAAKAGCMKCHKKAADKK